MRLWRTLAFLIFGCGVIIGIVVKTAKGRERSTQRRLDCSQIWRARQSGILSERAQPPWKFAPRIRLADECLSWSGFLEGWPSGRALHINRDAGKLTAKAI